MHFLFKWRNYACRLCAAFTFLLNIGVVLANYDTPKALATCATSAPLEYVYEFAGTDKDPERKTAYFREDPSLGAAHLNFHFGIPFWVPKTAFNIKFDRTGERFNYLHQQLLSRYDAERIARGLPQVISYTNFRGPILEGYIPNFPPLSTQYVYGGRPANMTLASVPGKYSVDDLILWTKRLFEAAENGYIIHESGKQIPINNAEGIDLLSDVSQSTADSPNRGYYGCSHTLFHLLSARIVDPKEEYMDHLDMLMDFAINVMDPLFFRYHKYVVDLTDLHKSKLPLYSNSELGWPKVKLTSISVIGDITKETNKLTTFTQLWNPLFNHGLDFRTNVPMKILYHILNHEEFTYNLQVENLDTKEVTATVRLYLAPVLDEKGRKLPLQKQRKLFSELDKFKVKLKHGPQNITRHSTKSWITVPLKKSAEIFATGVNPYVGLPDPAIEKCFWSNNSVEHVDFKLSVQLPPEVASNNCGWPHHLLIPSGKKRGMQFVLFAMLTDWETDRVRSLPEQDFVNTGAYCGIFNDTYPDKRPMGFPFDRRTPDKVTLDSFLLTNMATASINIYHSDQIVPEDGVFNPSIK